MRLPSYYPDYGLDKLFAPVNVTGGPDLLTNPGKTTFILDYLSQDYQNLLNGIRYWSHDTFVGQKWGTMCYAHQGTTSLWNFNLAFNGLCSPLQLQPGMRLRFPLLSEVQRILTARLGQNRIGRTVTL